MIAWNEAFTQLGAHDPRQLIAEKPPEWLVEGLFPVGIGDGFGESGAGKSFMANDLAAAISSGQPFLGRKTIPRPVLYVCAENYGDNLLRMIAATEHRAGNGGIFAMIDAAPQLDTAGGGDFLAGFIEGSTGKRVRQIRFHDALATLPKDIERDFYRLAKELERETDADLKELRHDECMQIIRQSEISAYGAAFAAGLHAAPKIDWHREQVNPETGEIFTWHKFYGGRAPLVMLDTKTQLIASTSEIPSSLLNKCLKKNQSDYEVSFLTLSHEGRSNDDYLGSVNSQTDVDFRFRIIKRASGERILRCAKVRSGPWYDDIPFRLEPHTVQTVTKHDGAAYSTLIVNPEGVTTPEQESAPKAAKPTASGLLLELIQSHGPITDGELRAMFFALPLMASKKPDTQRTAYRRALESLLDDFSIEVENDVIRLAHDTE